MKTLVEDDVVTTTTFGKEDWLTSWYVKRRSIGTIFRKFDDLVLTKLASLPGRLQNNVCNQS